MGVGVPSPSTRLSSPEPGPPMGGVGVEGAPGTVRWDRPAGPSAGTCCSGS